MLGHVSCLWFLTCSSSWFSQFPADMKIFEFLLQSLVLFGIFTCQKITTVGKCYRSANWFSLIRHLGMFDHWRSSSFSLTDVLEELEEQPFGVLFFCSYGKMIVNVCMAPISESLDTAWRSWPVTYQFCIKAPRVPYFLLLFVFVAKSINIAE